MARPATNYNPSKLNGGATSFLHPYCITAWVICQGVFRNFLKFLFKQHHSLGRCDPLVVSLVTGGDSLSFPLTQLVYHRPHQKSTGNVAQIREKMRPDVCAICELTKSERCDIMEILPGAFDLGQPKTKGEVYPLLNVLTWEMAQFLRRYLRNENSFYSCSFDRTHRYNSGQLQSYSHPRCICWPSILAVRSFRTKDI